MGDEFEDIARLFRPLTGGAAEALSLLDDAAVIPSRPGYDLVVTKDAMVAGVHFLAEDPPGLVARKLLRVNLSDLAAKAAEPYAYLLAVAWPEGYPAAAREAFVDGLARDQSDFGLVLIGGDTVSTPGPLTVSATVFGWAPSGTMVRRSTALPGDAVLVTGTIGDAGLGLHAARGALDWLGEGHRDYLAERYRLPEPRLSFRQGLAANARACADVSDGLVADLGHIAEASGVAVQLDLERLPLSPAAQAWVSAQPDRVYALAQLATAGDDYELVCTADMGGAMRLAMAAMQADVLLTPVGRVGPGEGVLVLHRGTPVTLERTGWRHH